MLYSEQLNFCLNYYIAPNTAARHDKDNREKSYSEEQKKGRQRHILYLYYEVIYINQGKLIALLYTWLEASVIIMLMVFLGKRATSMPGFNIGHGTVHSQEQCSDTQLLISSLTIMAFN